MNKKDSICFWEPNSRKYQEGLIIEFVTVVVIQRRSRCKLVICIYTKIRRLYKDKKCLGYQAIPQGKSAGIHAKLTKSNLTTLRNIYV